MANVTLLTAKWCTKCPTAKNMWRDLQKEYKFDYKEIDVSSEEGKKLRERFDIYSVPTTIINNRVVFVDVPDKNKAINMIKQVEEQ